VELRAGDMLLLMNGELVVVEQVQHEILESPVTVYNFEVEDFHTYYVSEISVLVHNMCGQPELYRGGNNMTVRASEVKIRDGLVQPTRGISVNSNPMNPNVVNNGGAYRLGPLPTGLKAKLTNGTHYEIIPTHAMTLENYQSLLRRIKLTPF